MLFSTLPSENRGNTIVFLKALRAQVEIVVIFLKDVSSAHQGCIYLVKNTVKIVNIITI